MSTEILYELQETSAELFRLLASCNQQQVNTIPFENSWTPAQITEHVTRSNKGIAQALGMEGQTTQRNSAERAQELKAMFLDFTVKFQSPEFIFADAGLLSKGRTFGGTEKISRLFAGIGRHGRFI